MAEIYEEMSELLDKQVDVQKESLKKLSGIIQAHEKVCDENERKKEEKTTTHKIFVICTDIKTHDSESQGQEEVQQCDH